MRVLVTGGAGFIASHVVDAYIARGHAVTVIDDFSSGSRENVHPKADLLVADLRQPATIDALRGRNFDVLNHHAAQIDVRVSVADPAADAELNIVATLRLFEAMRAEGVKKIVFASSGGATYGEPEYAPQDENHPTRPVSPYGCAKLAIDHYLYFFKTAYCLKSASLRYGNVYGPRQRKDGEAGVVAIFAGAMIEGETPRINGDGRQTRDYVYVHDVVRANMAASERDLEGIYNVGTGVETSVNDLYDEIRRAIGFDRDAEHGPVKPGEQLRSVLDATKMRTEGSLPPFVTLRDGVAETVASLRA